MKHHYWGSAIQRLLKPIHGLRQAALPFWQQLLEIIKNMWHKQSIANPCIYFSRIKAEELAKLVDDSLITGPMHVVQVEGEN